jgi:RHS repeat-associated protein
LTAISFPASSGEDVTFTYDDTTGGNFGVGRLTGFENAAGATSRVYNSVGLIESESLSIFGFVGITSYAYDGAGNVEHIDYPSGRVVTYTRDSEGQIQSVETQLTGSDPVEAVASSVAWQPFGGAIETLTFGNGLEWEKSFDLNYRLAQQKLLDGVTPMIQRSYTYGDGLNLTEVADDLDPSRDETYGYTANNMLWTTEGPYGEDTFSYDGVGNITAHVNDLGGSITDNQAGYSSTANHMLSIEQNGNPVRSFTYDANGNIATDTIVGTTTEYLYGHADRMYAVERGGVRLGEYYYNAFGQLVLRITTNTMPSGWTVYFYDQAGHPIAEYDGITADLLREYVWLGDTPIAVIEPGSPATTYYIHTDHIGRPMAMTDAGGNFVNETDFVVFGNTWSVSGAVGVDLRFPGQMAQYESGLFYNWNRQYDPTIARYTQPDPLGMVDGPSRYAYVGNDPLQKVDPTGQFISPGALDGIWELLFPPQSPLEGSGGMCLPGNGCPPCKTVSGRIVIPGTIAFRPLDTPDRPQHGVVGPHYNLYRANQNPTNCQCFWQNIGAVSPVDLPPGAIPIEPFAIP